MCLMVWIGTELGLTPIAHPVEPDPVIGWCRIEEVAQDAPIRARFETPHVTFFGSHEGCGCGFNSGGIEWEGFETVQELLPLLDALREDEREEFLAEQGSRERLRAQVTAALEHGPVEVYGCWAGDEEMPPNGVETIDAAWLTERTAPLEERVKYAVRAGG